jgi:hypothetical protein
LSKSSGDGSRPVKRKVDLPDNAKWDGHLVYARDLPQPTGFVSPLRGVEGSGFVDSGVSMPVGAVYFEVTANFGEVEVYGGDEATVTASDGDLPAMFDASGSQDSGDVILDTGDATSSHNELSLGEAD